MFGEKRSRVIDLALVLSTVVHVALLFLFSRAGPPHDRRLIDGTEVGFMDVTYRPEVAQVVAPTTPTPAMPGFDEEAPYPAPFVPEPVPEIELASMDRSRSQARIDLDRYETDPGEELDLIRLGSESPGKTTDEILAEPPVRLARGLDRSAPGTPTELRGYPGVRPSEPELTIEHRPLVEAPAPLPTTDKPTPAVVAPRPSVGTGVTVAGPLSGRTRIREPRPRYPQWALDRRISGTVVARIWVAPNGAVKGTPEVLSSSGYPDLDQAVVRALRAWEFAPLDAGVKQEDQYGDITFHFRLS